MKIALLVGSLALCALSSAGETGGASLRVRWAQSASGSGNLSLLPIDVALPEGLDRDASIARWTKPAAGREQSWDSLPVGTYQIVFRAATNAANAAPPVDLGEVVLAPADALTLTVQLPPPAATKPARAIEGAAAAIRVRAGRNAELLAGVRVTAVRSDDLAGMRKDLDVERIAIASAVTNTAGWTRLAGLPEQRIVFLMHAPGRTHPQVSEPFELDAGVETVLDDLLLDVPSNVHVTWTMPDELAKDVIIDNVELQPEGHNHWPRNVPIRGTVANSGAIIEDVPPGTWKVLAGGRLKNGFALASIAQSAIDIVAGIDRHVSLTIQDKLFRGRVTRNGMPIAGAINLDPAERGKGRRSAVAKIAADGTFHVLFDDAGLYRASIQETTGNALQLNRYVRFEDSSDVVEIELPAGRISGRVVDSAGMPVRGAGITAVQQIVAPAGSTGARVRPDGTFTVENIDAGTWELTASTDDSRSEPLVVSIDSADALENVRLLLEPIQRVQIRVLDATGRPVSDVFVTAEFPQPGDVHPKALVQQTGPNGTTEFRLSAAQQTTPVVLVVVALDLRLTCALRKLEADQTITLAADYGEVRLVGREWGAAHRGRPWLLSSTGCAVPFIGTRTEREQDGALAKVFPRLTPGTWSYVEVANPQELAALLTGQGARLQPVDTFTVKPRGTTRVVLPRER